MLDLLREHDGPPGSVAPQPGLADLGALADQMRHAGFRVELDLRGIAPGVGLAAYRIVQESLVDVRSSATAGV
jgi:hypothetical protein